MFTVLLCLVALGVVAGSAAFTAKSMHTMDAISARLENSQRPV